MRLEVWRKEHLTCICLFAMDTKSWTIAYLMLGKSCKLLNSVGIRKNGKVRDLVYFLLFAPAIHEHALNSLI